MPEDITHPSHLAAKLRDYPKAFLTMDPRKRLKQRRMQGETWTEAVPQYEVIHPGSFEKGDYWVLSVAEAAVKNLEDNGELEPVSGKERRWRLKSG